MFSNSSSHTQCFKYFITPSPCMYIREGKCFASSGSKSISASYSIRVSSGKSYHLFLQFLLFHDSILPIAFKKGKCTYTHYPLINYLLHSNALLQLSPITYQEALSYIKQKQAMNKRQVSLPIMALGSLLICHKVKTPLVAGGSMLKSTSLMEPLNNSRLNQQ